MSLIGRFASIFVPAYAYHQKYNEEAPPNPPSGGSSGETPSNVGPQGISTNGTNYEEEYNKLVNTLTSEKVAAYSIYILTPGSEEEFVNYNFFLVKNIEIGEEQSVRFRTLRHNKRTGNSKDTVPQLSDYPPMQEGENMLAYIQRVEALPHMEWNDIFFDESISIHYRGRTIYTYDEDKGTYKYLRGDKLSVKEQVESVDSKSSVVSLRPTKED